VWIYTGNKSAKFHGKIHSLSENIAKSFRRWGYFFDSHCTYSQFHILPILTNDSHPIGDTPIVSYVFLVALLTVESTIAMSYFKPRPSYSSVSLFSYDAFCV